VKPLPVVVSVANVDFVVCSEVTASDAVLPTIKITFLFTKKNTDAFSQMISSIPTYESNDKIRILPVLTSSR